MKRTGYFLIVGLSGMFWLGTVPGASAAGPQTDEERTKQITIGGAQYFVEGEVLKIDGESYLMKKDDTGEQVRLIVNRDTNLDCAAAPASQGAKKSETMTSDRIAAEKQAPQASQRQMEQGQRKDETARGGGFRIGQCSFQPGDRVKAEVDDMGRVTTLKYLAGLPPSSPHSLGPSAGTGELAIPRQEKPGQLDMTGAGGYAVLPIPRGEFKSSEAGFLLHRPVKDLKGKRVGTLEDLIMDTATGRVEYAIIAVEGAQGLYPVPWAAIKIRNDQGTMAAVIDTNQYQVGPDVNYQDAKDLSPAIKDIVKTMETLREGEPQKRY